MKRAAMASGSIALGVGALALVLLGAEAPDSRTREETRATIAGATPTTTPAATTARLGSATAQPRQEYNAPYDGLYHFVRVRFEAAGRSGWGRGRGREALWAHDYPRADYNFLSILQEMTYVRSHDRASNVVRLDDPELFSYPIAYIVEIGGWNPTDSQVAALGEYLLKGGFLIVDDFQGRRALENLAYHLRRALPGGQIMQVEDSDDVFDSFFRIVPDHVIPPYGGQPPLWLGVYEDNDPTKRLMVMINANNDIAEYWEYSDRGYYPVDLANEAYKLGVNYVVYGLTH